MKPTHKNAQIENFLRDLTGKNRRETITHGFCMTFPDAAARDAYLPHPEHEKVKAVVLEVLDGGLDGVVAFDYES